jgi:hypothetical protein
MPAHFKSLICLAAVTLVAISVGCASSSSRAPAASRLGVYHFWETIPETSPSLTLQGEVTVEADTILVEVNHGLCHYDQLRSRGTTISYNCSDVLLYFDRHNPTDRARYSVVTTIRVPVRTCIRYTTNAAGQVVCAQMGTRMEWRDVRRSGRLRLRPAA